MVRVRTESRNGRSDRVGGGDRMTTVATVDVPAGAFVLGEALASVDDYRAELDRFVRAGERFVLYAWVDCDDHSRLESVLRDHPRIHVVERYDGHDGRVLYELRVGPTVALLSMLDSRDFVVANAEGRPEGWTFELLANDPEELAAFRSACEERGVPIDVRRLRQSKQVSANGSGLTERQREMLRLAHEGGHFEVPRETTITELSEEMDVTPQAASKLLRRGLAVLVEEAVAGTGENSSGVTDDP